MGGHYAKLAIFDTALNDAAITDLNTVQEIIWTLNGLM